MENNRGKRLLSMVLCLTMALSVLSPAVSVGEEVEEVVDVVEPAPEPVVVVEEVIEEPVVQAEPEPQVEVSQPEPEEVKEPVAEAIEEPQLEPVEVKAPAQDPVEVPQPADAPVPAEPAEEILEPQVVNGAVDEQKGIRLNELKDVLSENPGRGEQQAYDDAVEAINNATDSDAIDAAFNSGKTKIAAQYALDQKKEAAYQELVAFADGNGDALAVIDKEKVYAPSVTEEALKTYVSNTKTQIQSILEAAAALEELNAAKEDALNALKEAKSVNAGSREQAAYDAAVKAVNDAEAIADVQAAAEEATAEDGSLAIARTADEAEHAAVSELEKAAADTGSESDEMAELLEQMIANVRAAKTKADVEAAKAAGVDAIKAQAEAEEAAAADAAAAAQALAEAQAAAKEEISAFVKDSYTEKFGDAPEAVTEAVTAANAAIDEAATPDEVTEVKEAQLANIEQIAVPYAKKAAIDLLDNEADDAENVQEAVLNAKVAIEAVSDESTLNDVANVFDAQMATIEGLKDANALAAAKDEAKAAIDALVDENASDAVKEAAEAAKAAIDDAENLDAVKEAQDAGEQAIADQKAADEDAAVALASAQEEAKALIDEMKSEEPGTCETEAIEKLLEDIDNAKTAEEVESIKEKIEETIVAAKAEDVKAQEADELQAAKEAAIEGLVVSENPGYAEDIAYNEAVEAINAVEMGTGDDALDTALSGVKAAKEDGQKAIDEAKAKDEGLAAEKTKVKAEIDLAADNADVDTANLDEFKAQIDDVKFDETVDLDAAKAEIAAIKDEALAYIDQLVDEAAQQAEKEAAQAALLDAIEAGKADINDAFEAIENPTNTQTKYVQDQIKELDALKADTEGTIEEIEAATEKAKQLAAETVEALKAPAAKLEALANLDEKHNALDEADKAAMNGAYEAAKEAIEGSETLEEMEKALSDYDAALSMYNCKKAAKEEIDQIADETVTGDLATARTDALDAIEACSTEDDVAEALDEYKTKLNAIKDFEAYKTAAQEELDKYVADKNGGAGAAREAETAKEAITNLSYLSNNTKEEVDAAVKAGKEKIDSQLKLDAYREAAKKELDDYLSVGSDVAPSEAPTEWKALVEAKENIDAETTTNSTQIDQFVEEGKAAMLAARNLDPVKAAAREKVRGYEKENATEEEKQVINAICDEIDAAETETEVNALVDGAVARIAVARGLGAEKEKAIAALEDAASDYEEKVADVLADAKAAVNEAADEDAVAVAKDEGINAIKQAICDVVYAESLEAVEAEAAGVDSREVKNALADAKTALKAAYDEGMDAKDAIEAACEEGIAAIAAAKELYEAKIAAKDEIEAYAAEEMAACENLDANSDALNSLIDEHKGIVDTANSTDAVDQFVSDAKEAIDLQIAKDSAKVEIDEQVDEDSTDEVKALAEEAKANIDSAENLTAVEKAKNDGKSAIAEQKGKDGDILEAAKAAAIKEMNVTDEETRGDNENAAYEEARENIHAATTINGVNKAKDEGQKKIDSAKILDGQIAEALNSISLSENAGEEEKKAYDNAVEKIKAATTKEEIDKIVEEFNSNKELLNAKDESIAAIEALAGDSESRGPRTQDAVDAAKAAIAEADTFVKVGKAEAEQTALVKQAIALDNAIEEAKTAIDALVDEDASDEVKAAAEAAKAAIDEAADMDAVKAAQEAGEQAIADQKAAEEAAAELADAKESAIEEVNAAAKDASGDVQKIAAEAVDKIAAAESLEDVEAAKNDALTMIADQKAAEEAAAELAAAKEAAKAAIDELIDEDASDEVKAAAEAAKAAIDEAADMDAVKAAQEAGEQAIADQKAAEADPVAEFVKRNYELILDREAEEDGLNYWTNSLKNKEMTAAEVVNGFMISEEFNGKGYSNEERVKFIYKVMLDREPDADGLNYWVGLLNAGVSDSFIVNGFATSEEFTGICKDYDIEAGTVSNLQWRDKNVGVTQFVGRCYEKALTRTGDVDGINYWCENLLNKYETPQQVAERFVFSEECIGRNLSDKEFVEMLYNLYMGRSSDDAGMSFWLGNLSTKTMTRERVSAEFAASPEFSQIVASYGL